MIALGTAAVGIDVDIVVAELACFVFAPTNSNKGATAPFHTALGGYDF